MAEKTVGGAHPTKSSRRLRSLPWGLIVAAVLAAGVERFVATNSLKYTPSDNWEWRFSGRAARREARGARVLALGSSLMKLGLVPRAVEPAVGGPVYNLGLCAGSPISSYFLLRRALEAGARPKAVVVEFHTTMMTESPWLPAGLWPDLLDARDALDLARSARDAPLFGAVMTARLLPSVKDRHGLRAAVLEALRGEARIDRPLGVMAMLRNTRTNLGAKVAHRRPGGATSALEAVPDWWICTPLNDHYLRRFLDLARRHGVAVVWVLPPVRPDLQTARTANGVDAKYKAYARSVLAGYPNVTVVDGTGSGFPADVFIDYQHLDREGALRLSAGLCPTLAAAVSGALPRGLWLELPGRTAPAYAVAVEDMAESSRAVRERVRVR
jgi:hypothetical protein